jgi:acetylornithine deacetylase
MQHWLKLFQNIVRCPSPFEREGAVVDLVEFELRRMKIDCAAIVFDPKTLGKMPHAQPPFSAVSGRRNLIGTIRGSGGGRSLALNCHLDVVPIGDEREWTRGQGEIVDNIIYGRGAYDDKAGVIICIEVLRNLLGARLRGDIIAQFVLEDETTGNGSLICLEADKGADAAIIIDGTRGDRGINEHAGNIRFGVALAGKPASVSVSHMGLNAAEMLAGLILEMKFAVHALNAASCEPWTRFPSPNQLSTIALSCHETTLTVPALASATCYTTFTPPHCVTSFIAMVEYVGASFAKRHGLPRRPIFDWTGFKAEPVKSNSSELESALQNAAHTSIDFGPSTGTSDMRHFVARGIPCVLFGPGLGHNPHRADECYYLDGLPKMVGILSAVARAWCA